MAGPAAAQLPFPTGRGGIGVGDIISIIGAGRGNVPVYAGQRPSRVQTAIGIATVLYGISRQHRSVSNRAPAPGPDTRPSTPAPNPYPQDTPSSGGLIRPDGYDFISNNGLPVRLDPSILPLTVNPGGGRYGQVVAQAVNTWNQAGLGQLFQLSSGTADLTIDWSGSNVSPGARAETRMIRSSKGVVPTQLSVRPGGRGDEQLARVVAHELGHVLGLDHSQDSADVMYASEQNRAAVLSDRDRQMVHWLYSQQNYSPAVGQTDVPGNGSGYYGGLPTAGTSQPFGGVEMVFTRR